MKLWGGNYGGTDGPDAGFWEFNRSFPFDQRLLAEEIAASRAYVAALAGCEAISREEGQRLDAGLARVLARAREDPGYLDGDHEDVHSFVEARLTEEVGELAGQSHLGRSRNEQTVVALRMFLRDAVDRLLAGTGRLVEALARQGQAGADAVMPGFTHMRPAEPITFGHLAAAHAWALVRDHERLRESLKRINVLPLGSGALAGTALPLDRQALARELGFDSVSPNALDAVMDRDFLGEFVFDCAQLQTHLARLATDLILLSGPEQGFLSLPDAFTTGSSLMPQKKNPDSLELVRGKSARLIGDLALVQTLLKGIPAGYQKDLQEDKETAFDAADTVEGCLAVMTGVVAGLELDRATMLRAAGREELMAASLAVALAREGMPFRKAHGVVGELVAQAQAEGETLQRTAAKRLQELSPEVAAGLATLFDPEQAVRTRRAEGGTAPEAVRASLAAALQRIGPRESSSRGR